MAVHFMTSQPNALYKAFKAAIEQEEEKGKITTWEFSDDGKYITHKASAWTKKAWFKRRVLDGEELIFNIVKPKNAEISATTYGYYHGHLIETFLNHFDTKFVTGNASAKFETEDVAS